MTRSTATVQTEHASRYLMQLCKHWAHRFAVSFDAENGFIDFGEQQSVTLKADAMALHITIHHGQDENPTTLQQVVADHIKRFAFREELVFDWH